MKSVMYATFGIFFCYGVISFVEKHAHIVDGFKQIIEAFA